MRDWSNANAANALPQGVNSMTLQQGGQGLLMPMCLLTVPPLAATFFQSTVGEFMAYNAFGQGEAMQPTGPGGGYVPAPAPAANAATQTHNPMNAPVSCPRVA